MESVFSSSYANKFMGSLRANIFIPASGGNVNFTRDTLMIFS